MMMKRTRPALWIPFIMVCWGVCTTLMGEYLGATMMEPGLRIPQVWSRTTQA
jgi:hypothetical protein